MIVRPKFSTSLLPMSKDSMVKDLWVSPSFPSVSSLQCVCLIMGINTSRKGYDRSPYHFCFLKPHCLLSIFKAISSLNKKSDLSGLSASLPNSHTLWVHQNPVLKEHQEWYMQTRQVGTLEHMHIVESPLLTCSIVPSDFTSSKIN